MPLAYGNAPIEGVLFDLDDVIVPFHSPFAWQWAWRPQGPVLGERRVRATVRRALHSWDRRRWAGLVGRLPPADHSTLLEHLGSTLTAIAGHSLPPPEADAVVQRMLFPKGEIERYPDVGPALDRLRALGVKVGVVTPIPRGSAQWLLRRLGLPSSLLMGHGDGPGLPVPAPEAFRAAAAQLGVDVPGLAYVGDLFWSDVHAAHRAGLASLLLDRSDAWPRVQVGRFASLDALESTLAAGPATAPEGESNR